MTRRRGGGIGLFLLLLWVVPVAAQPRAFGGGGSSAAGDVPLPVSGVNGGLGASNTNFVLGNSATAPAAPVSGNTFWIKPTLNYLTGYDGAGWQSDAALAYQQFLVMDPRWNITCDGTTDDTARFNELIAALPTSGAVLVFPPNKTCVTPAQLTVTKSNLTILLNGSTWKVWALNLTGNNITVDLGGGALDGTSVYSPVTVQAPSGATAITVANASLFRVNNYVCSSYGLGTQCAQGGANLTQVTSIVGNTLNVNVPTTAIIPVNARIGTWTPQGAWGPDLVSILGTSTHVVVRNGTIQNASVGFQVNNASDVRFQDIKLVNIGLQYGYVVASTNVVFDHVIGGQILDIAKTGISTYQGTSQVTIIHSSFKPMSYDTILRVGANAADILSTLVLDDVDLDGTGDATQAAPYNGNMVPMDLAKGTVGELRIINSRIHDGRFPGVYAETGFTSLQRYSSIGTRYYNIRSPYQLGLQTTPSLILDVTDADIDCGGLSAGFFQATGNFYGGRFANCTFDVSSYFTGTVVGTIFDTVTGLKFGAPAVVVNPVLVGGTTYTIASGVTVYPAGTMGAAGTLWRSGGATTTPGWSTAVFPNAASIGDLVAGTASNAFGAIPAVASGQVLTSAGVGALPAWTGSPTLSGVLNFSSTGSAGFNNLILSNVTSTNAAYGEFISTGGNFIWGVNNSVGSLLTGGTAYAGALFTLNATPLEFGTNNAVRGRFAASGGLFLLNLTVEPSTQSTVCIDAATHEVYQNAAATCTVSTARAKRWITTLPQGDALRLLARLRPVTFYEAGKADQDVGLVAEEVAKIDPRFVSYDAQGHVTSVKYEHVVAVLIAALQELLGLVPGPALVPPRATPLAADDPLVLETMKGAR